MSVTFSAQRGSDFVEMIEGVNLSNANAGLILDHLGLRDELSELAGECDAADLRGRILVAQGLVPADEGVPATTHATDTRWVDAGRRPGYTEATLQRLEALAEQAQVVGAKVVWA